MPTQRLPGAGDGEIRATETVVVRSIMVGVYLTRAPGTWWVTAPGGLAAGLGHQARA